MNQEYKQLPSGLIVPAEYKRYPIAVDLFAGIGGFSLGFIQAGWEIVAAVEWDYCAAHTYLVNLGSYPCSIHFTDPKRKEGFNAYLEKQLQRQIKANARLNDTVGQARLIPEGREQARPNSHNLYHSGHIDVPGHFTTGSAWIASQRAAGKYYPPVKNFWLCDIRQLTGQMILDALNLEKGDIDCVMGGPPCQGFSTANTKSRKRYDPRNNMVFEFGRLICELQPKTFVMENVPAMKDMRTPNGNLVLDELCMIFERGEYLAYDAAMKALGIFRKKGKEVKYILKERKSNPTSPPAPKQLSLHLP